MVRLAARTGRAAASRDAGGGPIVAVMEPRCLLDACRSKAVETDGSTVIMPSDYEERLDDR